MPKLVVFSGAGLSAESGLATFRDNNGLWAQYDPMEVCNYENWLDNFALVHRFYNLRRQELAKVRPNAMHKYLATLEKKLKSVEVIHITQNVDDLLERAGARNIMHIHGELTKLICPQCQHVTNIGYNAYTPAPCEQCGYTKVKPKIIFFFEQAPLYAPMYEILSSLSHNDMALVIGTSGNVVDISMLLTHAQRGGKRIGSKILNNLAPSKSITESVFDKIFYKPTTEAIADIDKEILAFFN